MVYTNPIMTIHEHKTIYKPLLSLITARWYKNIDVEYLKGEY
jgi:hypothetical protein